MESFKATRELGKAMLILNSAKLDTDKFNHVNNENIILQYL